MRLSIQETHDRALPIWREAEGCGGVLVHVDAHHDMWAVGAHTGVTTANVVRAALRLGLFGSVVWALPAPAWACRRSRRALIKHLRRIADPDAGIHDRGARIETRVERAPVIVAPLRASADDIRADGDLLTLALEAGGGDGMVLDIDADVVAIGSIDYKRREPAARAWTTASLVARHLHAVAARARCVTLVRSCEGGFTPLPLRPLADALASRIEGRTERADAFERVIAHTCSPIDADDDAERSLLAEIDGPAHAAACYGIARCRAAAGDLTASRTWCARAVAADDGYRSPWRSRGFIELFEARFASARHEFESAALMDDRDAFAFAGLGMAARAQRAPREAESLLTRAVALDPTLVDAHRELADLRLGMGRVDAAREGFERAIALARRGHRIVDSDGWTSAAGDEAWMHARLSLIAARTSDAAASARHAATAQALGYDTAGLRRRLAREALLTEGWRAAGEHAVAAVRLAARQYVHDARVATEDLALALRRMPVARA
jgi:tetratricopeptide (TPR) repeat protein